MIGPLFDAAPLSLPAAPLVRSTPAPEGTRLRYTHNATLIPAGARPRYFCERSRFSLVGPSPSGGTQFIHARCKSNKCPYCGRVAMYRKRNRIYDRLNSDRETGAFEQGVWDFVTTTLRPSLVTIPDAYQWIKPAMAYAIQKVRQPRKGPEYVKRGRRWARHAWPGVSIEYMNDVDVQPGTQMPHIHALYFVRQVGDYLPSRQAIARELHYYLNAYLYRKLKRSPLRWEIGRKYPYGKRQSLAYVHFSEARSTENCAMYMALHNGKIWEDGREYPPKYRRFATSRGFLPKQPEKEPSGYVFVKRSLSDVATRLAEEGLEPVLSSEGGEQVLAFSLREAMTHPRVQWAIGTAPNEPDRRQGVQLHDPDRAPQLAPDLAEKMLALQSYWADEGAPWEVVWHAPLTEAAAENMAREASFVAWQRGESGLFEPSLCPGGDDPFWEPDFELLSEYSRRWPRCSVADLRHNLRALRR